MRSWYKGGTKDVSQPITGWRLWLFRIVAIIIVPVLLFGLLEAALRVVGYGLPITTFVKCKVNGTTSYCDNIKFSWRFFHPNVAREASSFVFPADKSNNTYRIFVMGASAAAGTPDGSFCFGRVLQVMLREQYPGANFEVITTAMPAINSHVVLEIAKDCTRHQADLFIVYLGNNEVVGPYGAGTVFTPLSSNLSLIRFGIALKATRLGQLMTNLLEFAGASKTPKIWRGLEMFLEKQVRAGEPGLGIVYRHFQRNLQDIRRLAGRSGTGIIFCTVPSNLKDNPPFASLHRPNLTEAEKKSWDELYQRGVGLEEAGNYAEAVHQYLAAAEIDGRYADLQFRLGRCYWAVGEYDRVRDRFLQARELDTLRFRADTRINEIIGDVAGNPSGLNEGVYLVDAVEVFERNSPHNTPGEELFYEHVHMNFRGGYLLAEAIFRQVEEILPERIARYRADERAFSTEAECARYLAYTAWDRFKIADEVLTDFIKQPPFTNQLYHSRRVGQMEQKILKALEDYFSPTGLKEVQAQYHWAVQQTPSDWWLHWKYAGLLEELGDYNAAAGEYRLVLSLVPNRYRAHAKLGYLSGKQGDLDAAIEHSLRAIQINPTYADAYFNVGVAYQSQDRPDDAVKYYSKAVQFAPYETRACNNLGLVLYRQGKISEAMETYRNGLEFVPDDLDLHYNLGVMLAMQGRGNEAVKELRAALQIDPNCIEARKVLEVILKKTSR